MANSCLLYILFNDMPINLTGILLVLICKFYFKHHLTTAKGKVLHVWTVTVVAVKV